MTEAEAAEYFGYNIEGAYVGVKTPMYIWGDYDALED
jgi:hypothetical protein